MKGRREGILLGALAFAAAVSMPALAAEPSSGSVVAEADARYEEGVRLLKKNKFEEARVKLTQAFSLDPLPNVALTLGIAEEGLGRHADALRHVKFFLEHPKSDPKRVAEVRSSLYDDLWKRTGHLSVKADTGVEIVVDGQTEGRAPLAGTVDVPPGDHTVKVGAQSTTVQVAAGETKNMDLASKSASGPIAPGSNGAAQTHGPSNDDPYEKPPASKYWISGTFLGLGLVSVGAGIVFSVQSQSARTDGDRALDKPTACDLTPTAPACVKAGDAASSVNRNATLATIFYVGGAAFLLAGAATFALWPDMPKKTAVRVEPGFGSLYLRGRFE